MPCSGVARNIERGFLNVCVREARARYFKITLIFMSSAQNCSSFPEVFSIKHTTDIRDLPLFSSLSVENDGQVCTILYGAHLEECSVLINQGVSIHWTGLLD